jgi:phosphatidylglycerol:prolipoprotein diacylglycerol transferase
VAIWSGGIGLWGGIIGGFVGGITYALITKKPAMLLADITAPAFLFAQSIGRLGDIVNGEHCARATGQFFGFIWTNSSSAAINCANGIGASVHPVIAYEILWNMIGLLIIWKLRNRLTPPGMIMFSYFAIYSAGRFVIQFFREDPIWALGLQEAQFIAIIMLTLSIIALALKAKLGNAKQIKQDLESIVPQNSRAEKRRQLK